MNSATAHDTARSDLQRVRKPQVWCYRSIPLYKKNASGKLVTFKQRGTTLAEMGFTDETLPDDIYALRADKLSAIDEVQGAMNKQLVQAAIAGDSAQVKSIVVQVVEETFADPRSGNLEGLTETVKTLVSAYADSRSSLIQLALMADMDYSTAMHSVNVAALVIAFCLHQKHSKQEVAEIGLGALLHDLGKLFIDQNILKAQRKLTDDEFREIRKHPLKGLEYISEDRFPAAVSEAIGEHHEKIDGSGYPFGLTDVSYVGQIVGLVDCYEALTSDERVYRKPMSPLDTLTLLKGDMLSGKFSAELFEQFAYSLI